MSKSITATGLGKLLQEKSDLVIVDVRRKPDYYGLERITAFYALGTILTCYRL